MIAKHLPVLVCQSNVEKAELANKFGSSWVLCGRFAKERMLTVAESKQRRRTSD